MSDSRPPTIAARFVNALRLGLGLLWFTREERDMRDEIRFHIDRQTAKNIDAGMAPEHARRAARLAFGGESQWADEARDELRSRHLEDVVRDTRYGVRSLLRDRVFTTIAVLTLALGVAASVTAFSYVDSLYLRPLAVPTAGRLVRVFFQSGGAEGPLGYAGYSAVGQRVTAFDAVVAHYSSAPLHVAANDDWGEIQGAVVSASYFPALGLRPALGRFFSASEDAVPDRDFVAVVGYGLWQSRFGGDPSVIGRKVSINGSVFTIIGVAPKGFDGVVPSSTVNELWIPMMMIHVGYHWCDGLRASCGVFDVIGRLAPGATLAGARSQLSSLAVSLAPTRDQRDSVRRVVAEAALGVSSAERQASIGLVELLAAIAVTLLVVACANTAGLVLARGLAREREIAVRRSLGATRSRVVRQLLTESFLVAGAGGGLGVAGSLWTSRVLAGLFAADSEGYVHRVDMAVDARVVLFALAVSMVTALVFGLVPALMTSRTDSALRSRDGGTKSANRARRLLVTVQTALCLVLFVAAGLMTRSFANVATMQNLDARHVALLRLRPRLIGYDSTRAARFLHTAIERLQATPGVEEVSLAAGSGLLWKSTGDVRLILPTEARATDERQSRVLYQEVSPHFFRTLRVPVIRGREFGDADAPDAPRVVIVSERLARRLDPTGAVVGRSVLLDDRSYQIVGVVGDYLAHRSSEAAPSMAYFPLWQQEFGPPIDARMAVRVNGDPEAMYPALRRAIASADPNVPVSETLSMESQISSSFASVRLGGIVLAFAAGIALLLTAVGLYGVVAFLVARRTREIGIRLAIGAPVGRVLKEFVVLGARPMIEGTIVGLIIAAVGARILKQWLFGVRPLDAVTFSSATVAVLAVALLASWIPARRATRISPVIALRGD